MENASKALIIAGAILIAVMLISLFMYVFGAISEFNTNTQAQRYSNHITASNRFFVESAYDVNPSMSGIQIYGYDAYNIIRKAKDVNEDENAEVVIEINSSLSIENFDSDGDGKFTDAEIEKLRKQFTYSYSMDLEGFVNRITISG